MQRVEELEEEVRNAPLGEGAREQDEPPSLKHNGHYAASIRPERKEERGGGREGGGGRGRESRKRVVL